jgi:hypothetical protein
LDSHDERKDEAVTEENPHKIRLWTELSSGTDDQHTLECAAEGCNWKIPTNTRYQEGARLAAQEHIDMWSLRQANAGHAALIAKLGKEKAELIEALNKADEKWKEWNNRLTDFMAKLGEGEMTDGYHTHNELYAHRRLLTLHAVHAWLAAGYQVVKSWKHSDGKLCFGGGWFIIVANLPIQGQVSYHYQAEHWDLFDIPTADTPPEYDGHEPMDVLNRLNASSSRFADDMTGLRRDSDILNALYAGGVDNWQGYEIALEEMENDGD